MRGQIVVPIICVLAIPLAAVERSRTPQTGYEIYRWATADTVEFRVDVDVTAEIEPDVAAQYGVPPSMQVYNEHYSTTTTETVYDAPSFGERVGGLVSTMAGTGAARTAAGWFGTRAASWAAAAWPTMASGEALGALGTAVTTPTGLAVVGIAGAW